MSLNEFIKSLEKFRNSPNIAFFDDLINSLNKLNKVIGMKQIKNDIISQIKFYLVNKHRKITGLDFHMFHTVLTGPPGCGKTTIAEIMAEIWVSLGIIEFQEQEVKEDYDLMKDFLGILKQQKELEELKDERVKLINKIIIKNETLINVKEKLNSLKNLTRNYRKYHSDKNYYRCIRKMIDIRKEVIESIELTDNPKIVNKSKGKI